MSKIEVNTVDTQCGTNLTVGSACKSVTVAGNDIRSNAYKAGDGGNLVSQSGTTITLGASGDTVSLASGASQTGFGRTGTVNWDTTKKTTSFTAVSGTGYFVDTSGGAVTATLPASPSAGDIVGFNDYARTFATNKLTVARNGSNIQGTAVNGTISTSGQSTMFVYVDATQGWIPTEDQTTANYGVAFITATGGTITTCGDYKIHTFTGPGTFTVCSVGNPAGSTTVDYLVVAGGAGGSGGPSGDGGGGGGAGGYRESSGAASGCYTRSPLGACVSALPVSAQGYPITVGGGGAGTNAYRTPGTAGVNSIFSTITSTGGGGGGANTTAAVSGGSGGGGGAGGGGPFPGAAGNTPPVSPPQGNSGGEGGLVTSGTDQKGGGGGGATAAGQASQGPGSGGDGGAGGTSSINGTPTARAGGGGGMGSTYESGTGGSGSAGGGNGGIAGGAGATSATANSGSGGGGTGNSSPTTAGNGGSGIVIIRYKFQ